MLKTASGCGLVAGLFCLLAGCASPEAAQARTVAANRMQCPPEDLVAGIERETPEVREWVVGCNFSYTRVHCTDEGCRQAEPKPPCIGDIPCFKEDPVSLRWVLSENVAPAPAR
jgi:hypothetical protein